MGIYDRDYINDQRGMGSPNRTPSGRNLFAHKPGWSVNTWLIIINVVVFVLMKMFPIVRESGQLTVQDAFQRLEVWRLITFQFLHSPSNIMHIGFNMLGLWIFGPMVERYLGGKKYLAYYLVCGLFGGLLFVLLTLAGHFLPIGLNYTFTQALIGASAGVFGVIVACAYISPNTEVMLLFPPIPMKMKTFAYGYVAFAFLSLVLGSHNAGGEAAHVGGAIAGFFFIRQSHLLTDFFDVFGDSRQPKSGKGKKKSVYRNYKNTPGPHPDEVDRILQKVSQKGLGSLSDKEKKTLAEASKEP